MATIKLSTAATVAFYLMIQFIGEIQCKESNLLGGLVGGLTHTAGSLLANDVLPILQSPTTQALLRLRTVNMTKPFNSLIYCFSYSISIPKKKNETNYFLVESMDFKIWIHTRGTSCYYRRWLQFDAIPL